MEEFKIKEKIYDMILYGSPALTQFPKVEKYALAGDIRKSMYRMLMLAVTIEKKYYKKTTLQELDIELDILRHLIRLAADKKLYPNQKPCLPFKKYEYWAKLIDEIGRMIGGYMKSVK
ncbi:diversity-generating retroelement protein Avd [Tissierella sp. MSJ-40]|uniref:Diversity-generating retroelement protein Avd n=1 Tax=Tissierella simiarum TaxID=2841534 RepID=A0ABS6E6V8_9FIRM|nr:diversity-generating retroelement protein Avd [Tissierella simiarum]MBU5438276.1 diversity-generating retroelement protein Avd [Tissierella simiarum]